MKPIGNRVLIHPLKEEKSGITMAEDKKVFTGKVISIGKDVKEIHEGDTVIYSPFHFEEIGEVHIADERDVWCIVG